MRDEQNSKNIFDIINKYPLLKNCAKGGGFGLIFAVIMAFSIELIKKAGLSEIIEWFIKLKALIQSLPNIVIISLAIILCVFLYLYKKMHDNGKFKQRFLKDTKDIIENDPTISNITIQGANTKDSISISIQRNNKKSLKTKTESNIVDFQHRNDSEVK